MCRSTDCDDYEADDGLATGTPGNPGSPWAIGAAEGGHTAVHPELGTLADFDRLVARAGELGLDGSVLKGELDIFGTPWNAEKWAKYSANQVAWDGGDWNGSTWTGTDWSGLSWSGLSWSGLSWSSDVWTGLSWK